MTKITYKKPPITQAVIDIEFARSHDSDLVNKFRKKVKDQYDSNDIREDIVVDINTEDTGENNPIAETTKHSVFRYTSDDMTEQLLVQESNLVVAQLAPYTGWDDFYNRFSRDWKIWKKVAGHKEVKKIGIRYINRIDVPIEGDLVTFPEYVNLYPNAPHSFGPNSSFTLNVRYKLDDIDAFLTINSSVVKSPLLNHMSLMLDQDIVKTNEVPQSDDNIFAYIKTVHDVKNNIFEACITNKARKLFDEGTFDA